MLATHSACSLGKSFCFFGPWRWRKGRVSEMCWACREFASNSLYALPFWGWIKERRKKTQVFESPYAGFWKGRTGINGNGLVVKKQWGDGAVLSNLVAQKCPHGGGGTVESRWTVNSRAYVGEGDSPFCYGRRHRSLACLCANKAWEWKQCFGRVLLPEWWAHILGGSWHEPSP